MSTCAVLEDKSALGSRLRIVLIYFSYLPMVWPPEPGDDPMTAHLVVPREKWFKTPATFIYVLLALILPQNNRSSQLRVWCLLCQGLPDHVYGACEVKVILQGEKWDLIWSLALLIWANVCVLVKCRAPDNLPADGSWSPSSLLFQMRRSSSKAPSPFSVLGCMGHTFPQRGV